MSSKFPSVALVVPNLNLSQLERFFENNWPILSSDLKNGVKKGKFELIIVSSALNARNLPSFQDQYSQVKFVSIEQNHGFASTVNIGLRIAQEKGEVERPGLIPEWLGTINDDVELTEGWLTNLLEPLVARHDRAAMKVGSLNPLIYKPSGELESAGIKILPRGKAQPITILPKKPTDIVVVDATNAAAVIYCREALAEVGLFDERFGSYLEDIDLSLRLKRAGWTNVVVPHVKVVHHRGSTSSAFPRKKAWQDLKNWWLVILKNWPLDWWIKYWPSILLERGRNLSGWLKSLMM